jgi:hypothetical protein
MMRVIAPRLDVVQMALQVGLTRRVHNARQQMNVRLPHLDVVLTGLQAKRMNMVPNVHHRVQPRYMGAV